MANHRPAAASRTARIGARPPPCARTTDPPARRPRGAPGAVWRDSLGAAEDEGQPAGRPCASHVQDRPRSVCAPRQGIHTASPTLAVGWRPGPRSATPVPRGDLRSLPHAFYPGLPPLPPRTGDEPLAVTPDIRLGLSLGYLHRRMTRVMAPRFLAASPQQSYSKPLAARRYRSLTHPLRRCHVVAVGVDGALVLEHQGRGVRHRVLQYDSSSFGRFEQDAGVAEHFVAAREC